MLAVCGFVGVYAQENSALYSVAVQIYVSQVCKCGRVLVRLIVKVGRRDGR